MPSTQRFSNQEGTYTLDQLPAHLDLQALLPGDGPLEIEIGFGKGRYLLEQAMAHPERRYLGIEVATKYYKILNRRARRRELTNLLAVRGEALYLLSTTLPQGIASVVHVYFPDPWPKSKHHRRRLFDPQTVDLVLGLMAPDGQLCFATDFLEYGELVHQILLGVPGLEVREHEGPWPDGARTHYESKYMVEGRPILRLTARFAEGHAPDALHPEGKPGILTAWRPLEEDADSVEGDGENASSASDSRGSE